MISQYTLKVFIILYKIFFCSLNNLKLRSLTLENSPLRAPIHFKEFVLREQLILLKVDEKYVETLIWLLNNSN